MELDLRLVGKVIIFRDTQTDKKNLPIIYRWSWYRHHHHHPDPHMRIRKGCSSCCSVAFSPPSTIISESAFDGGNYDEDEDGANQCKCCFSWPSLIPPLPNNTNQGCICSHVCEEKYTSWWEDALGRYYWLRDMNVDIKGDQWITHTQKGWWQRCLMQLLFGKYWIKQDKYCT